MKSKNECIHRKALRWVAYDDEISLFQELLKKYELVNDELTMAYIRIST